MKKILIVDDETGIVNFMKVYFSHEGYEVYTAYSAEECLKCLNIDFDIILLDIMLPGMDGLELCRMIRDRISCPIIFLSARIEERDRIKGLAAGGDDYILKPFSMEELGMRVKAHLRREDRVASKSMVKYWNKFWVDYTKKQVGHEQDTISVTPKEFGVIELLSLNAGRVFSKEYIYEKVWGYDAEGDADTAVMEHIKRIRKKIERDNTKLIETVWGMGYRWKS